MGHGGENTDSETISKSRPQGFYSWEDVREHNGVNGADKWIVITGDVFDVTRWSRKHPGGSKVISHFAGQDATEPFEAFHPNPEFVQKYMKAIHIGRLQDGEYIEKDIVKDLRKVKELAVKMGLFKPSYLFFSLVVGHIMLLDLMAYLLIYFYGLTWWTFLLAAACLSTAQAQAAWSQHDFGHLSVSQKTSVNHALHFYIMGILKGGSSKWWNHMHYQHHAKPNVMGKDPDVRLEALFVLGDKMPLKVAKERKSIMPYNHQHKYFPLFFPPLLFPVYFQFMLFWYIWTRREWTDGICVLSFYFGFTALFYPLVGLWRTILLYEIMRIVESIWFTWVAQANHIPMEIDEDKERPWLELQLKATCNIEKSFFNDWFTGHLNFQIEHHLFPTMPRHNLHKISSHVRSLCEKHGVEYKVKTMSQGFYDIVGSLHKSGQIWFDAYYGAMLEEQQGS